MPRAGDWTVADLHRVPDDGLQYELADGTLLVSPAPGPKHQRAVLKLAAALLQSVPDDLEVFVAPLDFQPTSSRSLQPDVLVVRRSDVGEQGVTAPPLLVAEVLSASTRAKDLVLKRALYEDSGVPSYWVVDPDEPSLVVLELRNGRYVERTRVVGVQVAHIEAPFAVSLAPEELTA